MVRCVYNPPCPLQARRFPCIAIGMLMLAATAGGVPVLPASDAVARLEVLDSTPPAVAGRPLAIPVRIDREDLWRDPPELIEVQQDDESMHIALVAWLGTNAENQPIPGGNSKTAGWNASVPNGRRTVLWWCSQAKHG